MPAFYADLTTLANALSLAGSKVDLAMAGAIRTAAFAIQNKAEDDAPKRTGALASSITTQFNGPLTAVIGPKVNYAPYQEFGTRGPYTILPKKPGGRLVFEVNGVKVYARKVTHPGLKAKPYMRPAAKDVIGDLVSKIGGAGVKVIVTPDVNPSDS